MLFKIMILLWNAFNEGDVDHEHDFFDRFPNERN